MSGHKKLQFLLIGISFGLTLVFGGILLYLILIGGEILNIGDNRTCELGQCDANAIINITNPITQLVDNFCKGD